MSRTIKHSDVVQSVQDYYALLSIIAKAKDLADYYHGDTHASAEYFHVELGLPLKKCQQILRYCRQEKIFNATRTAQNVFTPSCPSKGFTGFNKPHAKTIGYYSVDKNVALTLLPIWRSLLPNNPVNDLK
jgi:hypothetical protein